MIAAYIAPPAIVQFAAYRSSFSSSRSYSNPSRSYSSTRTSPSSSSRSYSSTRSSSSSSKSYSSTRSSTSSAKRYTSTRPTVTRSNLTKVTTPTQRTTVIHNYYSGYYGYNSFFHPFGWGMGGGDFWFWMWMFDRPQYNQNAQILQASNVSAPQHSNWLQDTVFIVLTIGGIVLVVWLIRKLLRHLIWI